MHHEPAASWLLLLEQVPYITSKHHYVAAFKTSEEHVTPLSLVPQRVNVKLG